MAVRINSNIASLQAQRSLSEATATISKSYERLSSGQRINSAGDDAAGLAIAENLRLNSKVYNQARKNLNDGVSLTSIAEGAVNELKNIVTRVRELATQAANGSYSTAQRTALSQEAAQLKDEYNRIIRSTQFNGQNVFDEKNGRIALQGGYGDLNVLKVDADETIDHSSSNVRISTNSQGQQAVGGGGLTNITPQITADARYVLFESGNTNLVSGDTNSRFDIFLKDLITGETRRVNTDSAGNQSSGGFLAAMGKITDDARYVAFFSDGSNLVAGDINSGSDIFLKDLVSGATTLISTSSTNQQGTGGSSGGPDITNDGRYIVFNSDNTNLVSGDSNAQSDIFLKDVWTGTTTRINTDSSGKQAAGGGSYGAKITDDGRYLIFESDATNLVNGDTNARTDIFMKDLISGITTRVNTDELGNQATAGNSYYAQITNDGRYAVFDSEATNLVAGDTNTARDVFLKDLQTGNIKRVSTTSTGAQAVGNWSWGMAQITDDARYVAFSSDATNFYSGGSNWYDCIFVKDLLTGNLARVGAPYTGIEPSTNERSPQITKDGRYVVWGTNANNIVPGDTNNEADAFLIANPLAEKYTVGLFEHLSLVTQSGAAYAQTVADQYLQKLNSFQGKLGAVQSRLGTATAVISAIGENSSAAESRIRDADVAAESSTLLRTQIIQNAAAAILAQANQQPQLALTLLQG